MAASKQKQTNQSEIDCFYMPKAVSSKNIVLPIVNELISSVFKSKKAHVNVNKATVESWKKSFPWLAVVDNDGGEVRLKCTVCEKYKADNIWATGGASNIQKSAIDRHCTSKDHLGCQKKDVASACVDSESDEESDSGDIDNQDKALFRTVYSLMKNEIPLNKLDAILELQRLNGVEMPYQNLSGTTVSEIQEIIAEHYKKDIVTQINSSNYYAILLDESTDITVSKRLSVCVRYVKHGQAITSFLASVEIPDGCAYTIVDSVHKLITTLGIDLTKCVSLATDGASVMMGRKTGVGVQMKSKFCPFITQTHCIAHRLNLAITDAIKKNETLKKFREMFQTLYNFMSASTMRINTLKAMQDLLNEPEISIKEPHSIRWLGLKKSVEVVYDCFGSLLATLSNLAIQNPTAKGLFKYFSNYKTALLIGLMFDIHTELGVLSCNLQQQNLVFSDVYPLIQGTVGKLGYMKSDDGNGLKEMRESIDFGEAQPTYKGETLKNYKDTSDSEFETLKCGYIDNLIENINKRIRKDDSKVLSSLGLLLEPISYSAGAGDQDALECLSKTYCEQKVTKKTVDDVVQETPVNSLLNGQELKFEWQGMKAMITGCYKNLSLEDFCKKAIVKHHITHPNFAKLAQIGLVMQVTSVECERSFSAQNRLKTKYRAALKDESLEALLTVSLLGPPVAHYKPTQCIKTWLRRKNRRKKRLMEPYKPRTVKKQKKTLRKL